ncbi:MBL fold metallo-hydrolase [Novosphingobium sp. FSY-8]|uniref:MBL fold metallo-hydrolase n=1 Tax=Novosphingobium ovatum TaxID=1908523 RepID=A0ABW9XCW9_9SPHN|nr:MBL fold metallo-hydrolase [Novosphingobium ovatum]NBC36345.1 MBL fold metallo-hydrolase [Novosphingobium ovatum]
MTRPLLARLSAAALIWLAAVGAGPVDDPLTRPIDTANNARWMAPQAPVRVHGGTWLYGSAHLSVGVVDTPQGLVLIDAGLPQSVPVLAQALAARGRRLSDIRAILLTEGHYDHAGGVAAIVRASGARVYGSAWTAATLARGISDEDDPQRATIVPFPPFRGVRVLGDGAVLRIGGVAFTVMATPGHTPGSLSYRWRSCDGAGSAGRDCATIVFASSLNPLATGAYRYDAPGRAGVVAAFRRGLDRLRAQPCDIVLTTHPEHAEADARLAASIDHPASPAWRDTNGCIALADRFAARLTKILQAGRQDPARQ